MCLVIEGQFASCLTEVSDYISHINPQNNVNDVVTWDKSVVEREFLQENAFPYDKHYFEHHSNTYGKRFKRSSAGNGVDNSKNKRIDKNEPVDKISKTDDKVTSSTVKPASLDPNSTISTLSSTTESSTVNVTNITSTTSSPAEPVLPDKGSAEDEHNSSMSIFFVLCVLALGILLIHFMLQKNFQYLPESIAIVFLGGLIGLILNLMSNQNIANWRKEEAFSPTAFFLVLLPPIIFESGYNLHKGNFFQNIGSILVFAIIGTTISALVIGAGVYVLGLAKVAYQLSFVESFAFGSLISAVDPVATVAIFHAMDVDPVLNMLVFGESILNDAVAIVLTTSILESSGPAKSSSEALFTGFNRFCLMFFASAGIGVVFALASALLLKHVDLRKNPSLEFGIMLVFTYAPYALAEGIHLSGE
ncbi:hypothetical protein ANN_00282 [Periplaneta americana]|uniref:Sodium/hydrogen exchanger 8 n=1 Tax=Periplaneta americana TaxID=6978 RepID=A0ABQ8TSQ6_PERAM|nr:hypothetical protein ANN_00282 [Periplaneta americana]